MFLQNVGACQPDYTACLRIGCSSNVWEVLGLNLSQDTDYPD
jgi:hypothetical protein